MYKNSIEVNKSDESVETYDGHNDAIVYNVTVPTLDYYAPDTDASLNSHTALIIAPGGGFHFLSYVNEGKRVAEYFTQKGVSCFVLKYRVYHVKAKSPLSALDSLMANAPEGGPFGFGSIISLASKDGMNAVKHVRENAQEYGIDPNRIVFMGFSAGGTVTMGVAQHADAESRPNFVAPIYPYYKEVSGSIPVKEDFPMPAFIYAATDDQLKLHTHSLEVYRAMISAGQDAELHIVEKGGHGFGMRIQNLPSDTWPETFAAWLRLHGLLK